MTKEKNIISPYSIFTGHFFIQDAPQPSSSADENIYTISDTAGAKSINNYAVLEQYYNDVYKLFLSKLSKFDQQVISTETEKQKLTSLLQELFHVKNLLVGKDE